MINIKKKLILLSITAACLFAMTVPGPAMEIDVETVRPVQYEPYVLRITLPYFSGDPNDQEEIRVDALVTSPSGKKLTVPAFNLANKKGKGISLWETRFTPAEAGKYAYHVEADSASIRQKGDSGHFEVKKGTGEGFLRRSKNNSFYLVFDSGKPFFGIGHNIAWVSGSSAKIFDRYFSLLEKNGGNMTRVWMCDWSFPIEWKKIGQYNMEASKKLDELIELAKKRDIYIMLCIDTYGSLMEEGGPWGEDRWKKNPYNKANGGPCETVADFFTDPEAKKAYKNRLRYIISRWSYSPNILAFEIWNEYNAPRDWTDEMASYLKSINPHGQFVTTSLGYPYGEAFDASKIWSLNDIDITTVHMHGNAVRKEIAPTIVQKSRELTTRYGKPCVIAEFGIDNTRDDVYYDQHGAGTALHNSIWSSAMSKYFACAMNWWWNNYIRPKRLHYHYKGLRAFVDGVDWDSRNIKRARTSLVRRKLARGERPSYRDRTVKLKDKWGKIYLNEFTVLNNGDLSGAGEPVKYLHGKAKRKFKADLVFHVDYPSDGKFIIHVDMVSQGADLVVYIDEKEVLRREFTAGPGKGPWQRSLFRRDTRVYQAIYNTDIEVKIPAGKHTIRFTNKGKDWIGIKRIIFKGYIDSSIANARCLGLNVGDEMLFWIHNRDYNWRNNFNRKDPAPVKDSYFDIFHAKDGVYSVEWWDTFEGKPVMKEEKTARGGSLRIDLPEIEKDIACKIRMK